MVENEIPFVIQFATLAIQPNAEIALTAVEFVIP
jgi:hypothetical protein